MVACIIDLNGRCDTIDQPIKSITTIIIVVVHAIGERHCL